MDSNDKAHTRILKVAFAEGNVGFRASRNTSQHLDDHRGTRCQVPHSNICLLQHVYT